MNYPQLVKAENGLFLPVDDENRHLLGTADTVTVTDHLSIVFDLGDGRSEELIIH